MAGQSEAPRMRQPVAVADHETGIGAERLQRGADRRELPEGQQTGDVGEGHPAHGGGLRDDVQVRRVQHDGRGGHQVAPVVVGDVHPGHQAGAHGGRLVREDDTAAQVVLEGAGRLLGGRPVRGRFDDRHGGTQPTVCGWVTCPSCS
ncbi:hypothetical protein GCM10023329_04390 [Streptomyces sanyensis]|uniref:Uncharacterized protein n=1 Tax=Streptomyces sanyensis TaxID=568869 RepID=A0ABP8ZP30_9ACTN